MTKLYRSKLEYIMTEKQLQSLIDSQDFLRGETLEEKVESLVDASRVSKSKQYHSVIETSITPLTEEEAKNLSKPK